MTHFSIDDYGLTANELALKHNPEGDGEHPTFPRCDWREDVIRENTVVGYWDWVFNQLRDEQDELDRDNPFTLVKKDES